MFELLRTVSDYCYIIDYDDFIVERLSVLDVLRCLRRGIKIKGISANRLDCVSDMVLDNRYLSVIYNYDNKYRDDIVIIAGKENDDIEEYYIKVHRKGSAKPCWEYRFKSPDLSSSEIESFGIGLVYTYGVYELVIQTIDKLIYSICLAKDLESGKMKVVFKDKSFVPCNSTLDVSKSGNKYSIKRIIKG